MVKPFRPVLALLVLAGVTALSGCAAGRRAGATQTQPAATAITLVAATPTPLALPTETAAASLPAATRTTMPAATPTIVVTVLGQPSMTPTASSTSLVTPTRTPRPAAQAAPTAHTASRTLAATMQVDNWSLSFAGAASDPGKNPALQQPDPANQTLVVFLDVTNLGAQAATFTAFSRIQIKDEQGHVFADDNQADAAAQQKYGTDFGASVAPGATQRVAVAYEVPAWEKQFVIIQAIPAGPWTGSLAVVLS